jgi:tetratricopeptide (TPR) repeat protein
MSVRSIRRRREPIAIALLLAAVWIAFGIRRVESASGLAVLDTPFGLLPPRLLPPGWHFAPPGLLRISVYPAGPATFTLNAGDPKNPLVTREGIDVLAQATLRYRIDSDRVLEVHRALGPRFERTSIARWLLEGLRQSVGAAGYNDISGARTESLREALGRFLGERFREAGLVLLSCDVSGVRIRAGAAAAGQTPHRIPEARLLMIGLDGADWNIVDPLIAQGRMPNLARLVRSGTHGRLRTITPMLSPVIWTSVATGMMPSRHGIIDFLASAGQSGERVPVTSSLRKVKALWNILGDQGVSVGVVGWWATYPAERVRGFVVSDRVAYQLFGAHPPRDQEREGRAFPANLDDVVSSLTIPPETISVGDVARYVRLPADPASLPDAQTKLIEDFKTLLAAGDTYARIAQALLARERPEFMALYLEGTDTVAHLFMPYAPPPMDGVDPNAAQRFSRTVFEYYRHADEIVGKMIEAAPPGTAVLICSDHGFRTGSNRPFTDSRIGYGQAADWHRKYGLIVLAGAPFKKGHELDEASVLDLTPTVLALFGLPVADDMDGRPILDAFEPDFLKAHPISYLPSYESSPVVVASARAGPADPAGDRDLKERLRSLGYLNQDTANSHNNQGMLLLGQGKYDEAIEEFRKAVAASEDLGIARINIARALYKKKDYAAARAAIDELLKRQPRSKEAENLLANIAMEQGLLKEAEMHLHRALEEEPNFTDARNSLGILLDREGHQEEALEEFRKVIAIDKDYAEAYNNLGVILKKQGRADEAIALFKKAVAADREFPGSYSNLALLYEDRGDNKSAEEQFLAALKRVPADAAVRTNYGALLYSEGRLEEARAELEKAVAADPGYASAHNNLGAVYGRLGRTKDEIASYRKAIALDPGYADVHHNLGLALLRQGQTTEGENELRRALEIDPRYVPGYLNLGRSLLERGRVEEAAALLRRGAAEQPRSAEVAAVLGEVCLRLGRKEEGIAAIERSLDLNPNQPELRGRLQKLRPPAHGGPERAPGS